MLACCNKDCTRRFCEHCLSKSIGDDVNPQTSAAWVNGQWHCPVCRKLCCCAIGDCDKNHRHCKAYRYRVRRAEQQAVKRAGTTGGGEGTSPRDTAQGEGATSCSGVKAEQAVEISDDKGASQETAAAVREAIAQAKSTAMAAEPGKLAPPGHACVDAAQDRYGARVKAEARQDEPALAAPSAAAAPSASGAMSPSMVHRMRHGRAPGSAAGAGAGALDLNDVNTMADSWLRLLEQEEEDAEELSGFIHGGGPSGRGGGGSESGDSLDQRWRDIEGHAYSRSRLPTSHLGSSDSLGRIMAQEDGGGMMVSMSSQSLSDMMQRDGDVLSRNMSRDNLMHDTLLRNASDTSLTDMVRNYSSASLEAVMEHGQHDVAGAWPAPSPASDASRSAHKHARGGDFDFLQGGSEGRGQHGGHGASAADPDLSFLSVRGVGANGMHAGGYHPAQASTGKRMHRTNSHNKLVNEAIATVGRGMPRPPSHEKLSRQCGAQDEVDRMPTSKEDDE